MPTFTGYAIVQFLEKYFDDLVNLDYTSTMETSLDEISLGSIDYKEYLKELLDEKLLGITNELKEQISKFESIMNKIRAVLK